jgi:hypothetical protein
MFPQASRLRQYVVRQGHTVPVNLAAHAVAMGHCATFRKMDLAWIVERGSIGINFIKK